MANKERQIGLARQTCKGPLEEPVTINRIRGGCGEDLTKLIAAIPGDGKDHTVQCPVCGNVVSCMRKD